MMYLLSLLTKIGENPNDYDGIEKMVYNMETMSTEKLLQLKWLCDKDSIISPTPDILKTQDLLTQYVKERIV